MRRLFRQGTGGLTAPMLTSATSAGDFANIHRENLTKVSARFSESPAGAAYILAEITGYTAISGATSRWEYSFQEVYLDANLALANGLYTDTNTAKALNLCEYVNDGQLYEGPGWNISTAPTGFEIRPIQECVVQLWPYQAPGVFRWVFFAANVLDGECHE